MSPSDRSKRQVKISRFMDSLFGGGGAFNSPASNAVGAFNPIAAGADGEGQQDTGFRGGGFFGMLRQMWPTFSFGLQMIRTILTDTNKEEVT
ncbi:hypothetical protein [Paenibacillus durus]|uniref:hypothetical protein n=1 Tax=Paenibacillus durus TaxID=44251 RepID=UPI000693A5A3|nr:hypothetical protein [Paenibacillus durus]